MRLMTWKSRFACNVSSDDYKTVARIGRLFLLTERPPKRALLLYLAAPERDRWALDPGRPWFWLHPRTQKELDDVHQDFEVLSSLPYTSSLCEGCGDRNACRLAFYRGTQKCCVLKSWSKGSWTDPG